MLLDKDIREPLFEYLEEQHDKVRILEEKTMGRSRADGVMVLDSRTAAVTLHGDCCAIFFADRCGRAAQQTGKGLRPFF